MLLNMQENSGAESRRRRLPSLRLRSMMILPSTTIMANPTTTTTIQQSTSVAGESLVERDVRLLTSPIPEMILPQRKLLGRLLPSKNNPMFDSLTEGLPSQRMQLRRHKRKRVNILRYARMYFMFFKPLPDLNFDSCIAFILGCTRKRDFVFESMSKL